MSRGWWLVAVGAVALVAGCGDGGSASGTGTGTGTGVGGSGAGGGGGGAGGTANQAPTASFSVSRDVPLVARFDASTSEDLDGEIVAYAWDFGDGATADGVTAEHTYEAAGCYEVVLEVTDDGDLTGTAERMTRLVEVVGGTAEDLALEGLPKPGAVLPRDLATNLGRATLTGQVAAVDYESLVVRVLHDGRIEHESAVDLCEGYVFEAPVIAERVSHRIEVALRGLGEELPVAEVDDVVAGDVYLVNGQSNAVSSQYQGSADENLDAFVRSFGTRTENVAVHQADDDWHQAASTGSQGAIGQWPLRMASQLSKRFEVPVAVINGAKGGEPISYFERNDADVTDPTTNYGRLLDRARRAGVAEGLRGILFYQGESDGGDAPAHHDGFVALHGHWLEDFGDVERYYVTQIRLGCGGQIQTREVQRGFAAELELTSVMSTTGLDGHDGCHYAYADGYRELGDRYANLLGRDLYGEDAGDVEAVDVVDAKLSGDTISIATASDATQLVIDVGVESFFQATGGDRAVVSVVANGTTLEIGLGPGTTDPTQIAFVGHSGAGPWVTNAAGVGLLAFSLPVE